jgi:hypothetical protein
VVSAADPYGRNLGFLDRSRYFFLSNVSLQHIYLLLHCRVDCKFAINKNKVAPQLYSRG